MLAIPPSRYATYVSYVQGLTGDPLKNARSKDRWRERGRAGCSGRGPRDTPGVVRPHAYTRFVGFLGGIGLTASQNEVLLLPLAHTPTGPAAPARAITS